jgi:hypothetical protein
MGTKKKKEFLPKNLSELIEITDGMDYNRKKEYNDTVVLPVHACKREKEVFNSVNSSLNIEPVPRKKYIQTPDFKIESESLFIEVTSLNSPLQIGEKVDPSDWNILRKINVAIDHFGDKDKLGYNNFLVVGVIFIDLVFYNFTDIMDAKSLAEYIQKSTFLNSNVDFLLIRADSGWIKGESSEKVFPPFIFVKREEMKNKISKVFPTVKNVIVIS